jgi:ribosomal protein S12 methylthiotransferase accessory factor
MNLHMSPDRFVRLAQVVSEDVGLVDRVDEGMASYDHPRLATFHAQAADTAIVFGAGHDGRPGGLALDRSSAKRAAVGEALERYSACHVPTSRLRAATVRELGSRNIVVPPDLTAGAGGSGSWHWVPGVRLKSSQAEARAAWVPAHRVYLSGIDDRPGLGVSTSTGLACHPDPWQALRSGLLEVIERDAVMVSWTTRAAAVPIDTTLRWTDQHGITVRFDRAPERYQLYLLESPTRIPVVFAVVSGVGDQPPRAVGAAARFDLGEACRRALLEANQTFSWARHMVASGTPSPAIDQIRDLEHHVAYYLDHGRRAAFDFLSDHAIVPSRDVDLDERRPTHRSARDEVEAILDQTGEAGLDCYAVDATAPDVREAGYWVIRAIIPDLYPLIVGLDHRTGHPRLAGQAALNPDPHPFP